VGVNSIYVMPPCSFLVSGNCKKQYVHKTTTIFYLLKTQFSERSWYKQRISRNDNTPSKNGMDSINVMAVDQLLQLRNNPLIM